MSDNERKNNEITPEMASIMEEVTKLSEKCKGHEELVLLIGVGNTKDGHTMTGMSGDLESLLVMYKFIGEKLKAEMEKVILDEEPPEGTGNGTGHKIH